MKTESELRLSFIDLQQIFLDKYPNGKIEKADGIIKVWFNAQYKNSYYKYNGTLLEVSEKLKLEVKKYTRFTPVTPVVTDRKTGSITVAADDMGYYSPDGKIEAKYVIENGKISFLNNYDKVLKLYETKKGYYFNLNAKRYNIELWDKGGGNLPSFLLHNEIVISTLFLWIKNSSCVIIMTMLYL